MPDFVALGEGGILDTERIVAIGRANSAPVKRLVESTVPEKVLYLTYGYPRQSVILLENGFLAVVSLSLEDLIGILRGQHD